MRVPVGSWCSSPGKDSERCSASCSSVTLVWFLIRLWFAFFKKPSHFPEGGARSSIQIQQTPHCECNYRCRLSRGSRSKRRRKKEEIKSKCIQKRNQSLDAFYQPPKHILTASFANDNSQNFTPLKWNLPARFLHQQLQLWTNVFLTPGGQKRPFCCFSRQSRWSSDYALKHYHDFTNTGPQLNK